MRSGINNFIRLHLNTLQLKARRTAPKLARAKAGLATAQFFSDTPPARGGPRGASFYVLENKRKWPVISIKLNDKDDFMSRKKNIMIFDTWIVLWRLEGKRFRLTADRRRFIKAVESSSSQFRRP